MARVSLEYPAFVTRYAVLSGFEVRQGERRNPRGIGFSIDLNLRHLVLDKTMTLQPVRLFVLCPTLSLLFREHPGAARGRSKLRKQRGIMVHILAQSAQPS